MADYQPSREEKRLAEEKTAFERTRAKLAEAQYARERSTYNVAEKAKFFLRKKSPYVKFFLFLIILGLIVFVLYGFIQTGLGESVYEKTVVYLQESSLGQTVAAWYHEVLSLMNPQAFAFQNPQASEIKPEQPIGITIKSLTSRKTLYTQNQPIELIASVEVQGIDRAIDLKFRCDLDNYDSSKSIARITDDGKTGNVVETRVEKDQSRIIPVECNFPVEGQYQNFTEEEESEKIIFTRKATLNAIYAVETKPTVLRVYTLSKQKLDELARKNIDPFDFYRLKEALIREGILAGIGEIRAQYFTAPEILSMSISNKQPVSIGSYPLAISLKNDEARWHGELDKVSSLKLVLDREMEINAEECPNFEASGELKSKVIEALNNPECTKSGLDLSKLKKEDVEDCIDIYNKDNLVIPCEVVIKELPKSGEQDIGVLFLKLVANYDYKVKKAATVDIRKITKAEETLKTKDIAKTI